ncbi:glycoside hydrolase family 2 protein [Nitrospira moscoviensis]|uniref:Putative Glycoside hydrolase family 2 n=1 Tax=Nitrospira moscoviensis TaxID=42253 RepID=A0A0K2GE56_NITMO|nr:glycoside hydrolase family 2 [Nitrospira moscoviensis]ALA59236.1 putative Glycoside hydrolase family 2 [Nitrospira moscoviensis]
MTREEDCEEGRIGYPRPELRRTDWLCLNGEWDFSIDPYGVWEHPSEVVWRRTIAVPFAPETPASGIEEQGFFRACWYRRSIAPPKLRPGERWMLHFGAVDYLATVWLGGRCLGSHEGGYTPFSFDVTDLLQGPGRGTESRDLVVRAVDLPDDLQQPRGKQDWQREPHLIWYPRTTGIWQTVWLERLPATYIADVRYTPNLSRWEIGLYVGTAGREAEGAKIRATLKVGGRLLAEDVYSVSIGEVHRRIALSDPGIDDSRNQLLWSPGSPTLIDVRLELLSKHGDVIDTVDSYAALREVAIQGDRVTLNGRAVQLRMVLDQGYWPDTGMTPPDDAALRRDVELAKLMGFNGVRKHQKIEDPRYLYWADRLGLLVWEEMPSAYRFTRKSVERVKLQWEEILRRDYNHPCIMAWVPFNESWGVPNLPDNEPERHYVQALYHLTKTLDPTRPVVGNDGWESVATDIIGIHDYDDDPHRMARRYETTDMRVRLFQHERPGGRILLLQGGSPHADHPIVLSEFGGIAIQGDERTWGYSRSETADDLERRYVDLLHVVHDLQLLAGFCYTQFADTYQEANGLLYADRRPKFPIERIAEATRGRQWRAAQELTPGGPAA